MKILLRVVYAVLGLAAFVLVAGWLILAAPFFSELRRDVVGSFLTEEIGQPILINDDVSVLLRPVSRIYAGGVEIPSENIDDFALAELNSFEFDLDLIALLKGRVDLDNLAVDGLQVNMVTLMDGTTSWTKRNEPLRSAEQSDDDAAPMPDINQPEEGTGLLNFLSKRTTSFTRIGLAVVSEPTGFEFIFDLTNLNLDQLDGGARVGVTGRGSVNNQSFEIDGNYPRGAPFTTKAVFGAATLTYDGRPLTAPEGGGYTAHLALDTGEIGDILDILGLNRVLEGRGTMSADVTSQPGVTRIENFETMLDLAEGALYKATGAVTNLGKLEGFELNFDGRLHPEGQPPATAAKLKDLKLTGFHARIVSIGHTLEFEKLQLETNSFDQGLQQVGPVTIGSIRRTKEGLLAIEDVTLQAGPPDDPYIQASGSILNMLELKELEMSGALSVRASQLFPTLDPEVTTAFGGVQAEFSMDDASGHLSLNQLTSSTFDTDLWSLSIDARLGDINSLDDLSFDMKLGITETAHFLGALQLEEIDAGAMEVSMSAQRSNRTLTTALGLAAGSSEINGKLSASQVLNRRKADGVIHSDRLDIADIRNAVAAMVQLGKLDDSPADDPDVQPLVLPKEEEEPEDDGIQPLVLPEEDKTPADLFDLEKLLTETDLKLVIELKEIVGQKGISSLSSELTARDGTAQLGPLELSYGGGYFKVGAKMDLVNSPEIATVAGATSGWDFGEILDSVGLGIEARGTLRGNFNVTGSIKSANAFINSMAGSASISMANGAIATSLLELAGLGIFPWLFSEELSQGYAEITCIVAPVHINAGHVSFDSVVAETKSVQLVAKGHVDWRRDSIAIRAEPRRVGRPLSRSAWPFDVTGKLSDPQFKLQVGGSRPRISGPAGNVAADRKPCVPDLTQIE